MKKVLFLFLIIGLIVTLFAACSAGNQHNDEFIGEYNSSAEGLEMLENPLKSYFADSLYTGSITLDVTDTFRKYYQMQGSEMTDVKRFIHVKLTNSLEIIDLEGNNMKIDEIQDEDIIYLDFNLPNRINEFKGGQITIETDVLVVEAKT